MATETVRLSLANLSLANPHSSHSEMSGRSLTPAPPIVETSDTLDDEDVTMASPGSACPSSPRLPDIQSGLPACQIDSITPSSISRPVGKQSISRPLPRVELVDRSNPVVMSDILVLPRKSSEPKSSSEFIDLDVSGVPFLQDGRHRLWTGGGKIHQFANIEPNDNSRWDKHYDSRFNRWKELILGAEFWASIPFVANAYIQLLLNLSVVGVACFCLWSFAASLRRDVVSKMVVRLLSCVFMTTPLQHHAKKMSHKAAECRAEYHRNRCKPDERVPALERLCNDWALCMDEISAATQSSAALSAETLGQAVNTFLEQLTWKSVMLLTVGVITILICSNTLLSLTRWKFEKPLAKESTPAPPSLSDHQTSCSFERLCRCHPCRRPYPFRFLHSSSAPDLYRPSESAPDLYRPNELLEESRFPN